jgi:hypothetical protein
MDVQLGSENIGKARIGARPLLSGWVHIPIVLPLYREIQ